MAKQVRRVYRSTLALAATAALLSSVAACGDDDTDLPPPPASAPAVADGDDTPLELTPAEQEAVAEAREMVDEFFAAYVEEAVTGEPLETDIGGIIGGHPLQYATGELTQRIQAEFRERRNENVVLEGQLEWTLVELIEVDLDRAVNDRRVPAVWMSYCLDATSWRPIYKETGEPAGEPGQRRLATIEAAWFDDDGGTRREGWRVAEWQDHEAESC